MFNLMNYSRNAFDLPRECFKGTEIDELFYQTDLQSGKLPFNMRIEDFIRLSEGCIREGSAGHQFYAFLIKFRLLRILQVKSEYQPKYRLLIVRTLIEMCLHELAAGDTSGLKGQLQVVIEYITNFEVLEHQQEQKWLLVHFAEKLLERCTVNNPSVLPVCPASYREKSKGKRL